MKAVILGMAFLAVGCGSEFSVADRPEGAAGSGAGMAGRSGMGGGGPWSPGAGGTGQALNPWIDCGVSPPVLGGLDLAIPEHPGDLTDLPAIVAGWPIRFEIEAPRSGGHYLLASAWASDEVVQLMYDFGEEGALSWLKLAPFSTPDRERFAPTDAVELRVVWAPEDGGPYEPAVPSGCSVSVDGEKIAEWP